MFTFDVTKGKTHNFTSVSDSLAEETRKQKWAEFIQRKEEPKAVCGHRNKGIVGWIVQFATSIRLMSIAMRS